jgi:hypothetical protein
MLPRRHGRPHRGAPQIVNRHRSRPVASSTRLASIALGWGIGWTRAVGLLTNEQGVEAFSVTDRLSDSDRAAPMGDTLPRIHNR